jgi:hypothetical protein
MLFISSAQQDENSDTDGPGVGGDIPSPGYGCWANSVSLSVLAGFFPAWKASRYLPDEALRSQ